MCLARISRDSKFFYDVPFGIVREEGEFPCAWREFREIQSFFAVQNDELTVALDSSTVLIDFKDRVNENQSCILQPILLASINSCGGDHYYYCQKGLHGYRFSLHTFKQDALKAIRTGMEFYHPLVAKPVVTQGTNNLPEIYSFFEMKPKNVFLSTIRQAGDGKGFIVRFYEGIGNTSTTAVLRGLLKDHVVQPALITEDALGSSKISEGRIETKLKPFEIFTAKVT
jgi:hypothetical protein